MSGILGALSNFFTGTSKTKEPQPTSPGVIFTDDAQPDSLTTGAGNGGNKSQQKYPLQLFNINIDSAFPPVVVEEGRSTERAPSQFSFMSDLDIPEDEELEEDGGGSVPEPIPTQIQVEEDPGIIEIINSGIREFQSECLEKINIAFQLQVDQMTTIFSARLSQVHVDFEEQLEQELAKISSDYTNRFLEFDTTMLYYQESAKEILDENKKHEEVMAAGIQALILQMEEDAGKLELDHQTKLEESERELKEKRMKEKLEEHEKILEATNNANNSNLELEEQYKKDIQEAESVLEKIKLENQELEEKIEYGRIHALAEFNRRENLRFMKERNRHEDLLTVKTLEKKLEALTKQKMDMCYVHQQRITNMIETQSVRADHYNSEFRYFQSILEDARASYQEDLGHFEESARIQEEAHDATMEDLKNSYRSQVMNLCQSVYDLKRNTDMYCTQTESSPQLTQTRSDMPQPGLNTPSAITFELSKLQKAVTQDIFGAHASPN